MDLTDLDASGALTHAEELVRRRRMLEVEDLRLLVHWADLHAEDPRAEARASGERVPPFADRLVRLGGLGTPAVQEFSIAELAVSRQVHPHACENQLADALDLVHRLPLVWSRVVALEVERWVACKVARLTRALSREQAALVDVAVAESVGSLSPGRLIALVEAKVLEADSERLAAVRDRELRRRHVTLTRGTEFGLRLLVARIGAGDAVWVDAMVERVADLLAPRFPEDTSRDELRSEAFGWLARPAELLVLLAKSGDPDELMGSRTTAVSEDLVTKLATLEPSRFRSPGVVYVHLHQAAVQGVCTGVARVEGIGPMLLDQLGDLLGNAQVTVTPVIDLADRVSVDAYETPEAVKERVRLVTVGDYFPYAVSTAKKLDFDHVTPYLAGGGPGQTGTHNSGPLSRRHHRVKTHGRDWAARQLGPGDYVWRTPHHRYRLVDSRGTHELPDYVGSGFFSDDPLDRALSRLLVDQRRGRLEDPVPSTA